MDKTRLVITETFTSESEEERRKKLQRAVDQYIELLLQSKGGATDDMRHLLPFEQGG